MDIRNVKTTVESSKYAVTMNGVKVTSVCSLDVHKYWGRPSRLHVFFEIRLVKKIGKIVFCGERFCLL